MTNKIMTNKIKYEQKAQNYIVVTKNDNMIAQIMEGGMFGEGNLVVIDNFGYTVYVTDREAVLDAINRIIAIGRLNS